MKRKLLAIILSISMSALYSQVEVDSTNKQQDINYDMDLEALMNMDVSTVSKKSQSMSEAPAIVSVITDEQIQQYAVKSLGELMSHVPGFTVQDSYWKRNLVNSRGLKQTLYNDKILLLINGVPNYDAASLEYYLDVMPLISVKRVEIIRGPGSTLYGTNAFAAVINVITKDAESAPGLNAYISYGSFNTMEGGLNYAKKLGKFDVSIGSSYENNEGYKKENIADNVGKYSDIKYQYDYFNVFGNVKYDAGKAGTLFLNGGFLNQKFTKFGPMPRHIFGNNGDLENGGLTYDNKYYGTFGWDKKFSEKLSAKANIHYDNTLHTADCGRFAYDIIGGALQLVPKSEIDSLKSYIAFGGNIIQGEAQVSYAVNDYINFLGGITAEQRNTLHLSDFYSDRGGKLLIGGSTLDSAAVKGDLIVNDMGGYLQADGKFKFGLGYVAGVRITRLGVDENIYITPRAGLVYNLNKNVGFKLLYGEAFRGAGPQEQYYKVPRLVYGADIIGKTLKPESIKTIELATDISIKEKYKFRVNGFYNQIFDIITRRFVTAEEIAIIGSTSANASTTIYDNLLKQTIYGGEFEFIGYPSKYVNFWINGSYKDGKYDTKSLVKINNSYADTTLDFIPYMEHITLNAGINFKIKKLTISPNVQYVGERVGYVAKDLNYEDSRSIDPYMLFNLNISYSIKEKIILSVIGQNLLNTEYYYPEEVRKEVVPGSGGVGVTKFSELDAVLIPGGAGIGVFGKITFKL